MSSPAFASEPFTTFYQRSLYQSLRNMVRRTEAELRKSLARLPESLRPDAEEWLKSVPQLLSIYSKLLSRKLDAKKIRIHGDYHLGQVLNTGKDFVILDFEGEPRRSLGERLLKRSALVDVAGMLRSFDYAVQTAVRQSTPDDQCRLREWGAGWLDHISTAFLAGYSEATHRDALYPSDPDNFQFLLYIFLLDKTVYEIGYELSYRLDYLSIPLRSSIHLMQKTAI
jgi:maltose alpha-D-glucosyltransferase/alpha-amylase